MTQARVRGTVLHRGIVRALYAGVIAVGFCAPLSAPAQAPPPAPMEFDIPPQPLPAALKAFAEQAGMQLLYRAETVGGLAAPPLRGRLDRREALQRLLQGTGLEVVYSGDDAATIRPRAPAIPSAEGGAGRAQPAGAGAPAGDRNAPATSLDAITVTGTRIRGGSTPSPVITIGAERIREEGFADLGEAIRSLPQNFSGGQNPGVVNGSAASNANQNITGGSGLNLRGLGPDATLTLINGRRPSYGSFVQMVDISAIPIDAVAYIEIVPDGASAIYGSDAVGGVGNVVLKREFDGAIVGTRYGAATDGGLDTREYTATVGTTWATGGVIAAWKRTSNDPIRSDERHYARDMYAPTELYPEGDVRSGLLSAHQSLGEAVELRLDAIRTEREMVKYTSYGASYYLYAPDTTSTFVSPSVQVSLPNDWSLSIGGAWGEDETVFDQPLVTAATGVVASDYRGDYANTSRSYDLGLEGPLFSLPGGDARIAIGAGRRSTDFAMRNLITGTTFADGEQSSRFAYAEIDLPLIGPDLGVPGVRRLSLTGAIRGEDSDSFGGVTTPKLGLIYGPGADFTLKASWGRSFKAPTLLQQFQNQPVYLYSASALGGTGYPAGATALWVGAGGNPDLDPERARTWSASLAFHPEALPGLEAEASWFDIDYTDRVMLPFTSLARALSDPALDEFVVHAPSGEQQAAVVAAASAFYNYAGTTYDPDDVVAIVNNLYTNATRQRIRGLDLSASYRFDLGPGRMTLRGSASRLDSSRQLTAGQEVQDLAGNLFHPAEINGRIGAVWHRGGFSASAFAHYVDGVVDPATDEKGASFTTFDATLRYATGDREGAWSGLTFEFSAQNLFDRAPPLYAVASYSEAPYDSTNYSAIGRFLSVSVSRQW